MWMTEPLFLCIISCAPLASDKIIFKMQTFARTSFIEKVIGAYMRNTG